MNKLGNANVIGFVQCRYLEIPTVLAVETISMKDSSLSFFGHMFWITVGEEVDLGVYSVAGDMSMFEVKDKYSGVEKRTKEKTQ